MQVWGHKACFLGPGRISGTGIITRGLGGLCRFNPEPPGGKIKGLAPQQRCKLCIPCGRRREAVLDETFIRSLYTKVNREGIFQACSTLKNVCVCKYGYGFTSATFLPMKSHEDHQDLQQERHPRGCACSFYPSVSIHLLTCLSLSRVEHFITKHHAALKQ